jgi:hypothetical protein
VLWHAHDWCLSNLLGIQPVLSRYSVTTRWKCMHILTAVKWKLAKWKLISWHTNRFFLSFSTRLCFSMAVLHAWFWSNECWIQACEFSDPGSFISLRGNCYAWHVQGVRSNASGSNPCHWWFVSFPLCNLSIKMTSNHKDFSFWTTSFRWKMCDFEKWNNSLQFYWIRQTSPCFCQSLLSVPSKLRYGLMHLISL